MLADGNADGNNYPYIVVTIPSALSTRGLVIYKLLTNLF